LIGWECETKRRIGVLYRTGRSLLIYKGWQKSVIGFLYIFWTLRYFDGGEVSFGSVFGSLQYCMLFPGCMYEPVYCSQNHERRDENKKISATGTEKNPIRSRWTVGVVGGTRDGAPFGPVMDQGWIV